MLGPGSQSRTALTGQPGQDSRDGTARTGHPEKDCQHSTVRTGMLGPVNQSRTAGTEPPRQDSHRRQPEKDSLNRTARTARIGLQCRTERTGLPEHIAERLWALNPDFQCKAQSEENSATLWSALSLFSRSFFIASRSPKRESVKKARVSTSGENYSARLH
jgi:hypothetical protein